MSTSMVSPPERRRAAHRIAIPVTNMASVESMNGAPRIAPTPTSWDDAPVANRIAMIGIIVSGSAVPTAARTEPTAPSASPILRPNHSMLLVNSSAPIRITTKARTRTRISIGQAVATRALRTPTAITSRIPIETASISQSDSRA